MKQTHSGGCQCGRVRYEFDADIGEVFACNCSRCGRLGSMLAFVSPADFRLMSGADAMTEYLFNRRAVHHLFCSTCGIQSYATGKRRDGTDMVAINVRTLDDFDPARFTVKSVDGRSIPVHAS